MEKYPILGDSFSKVYYIYIIKEILGIEAYDLGKRVTLKIFYKFCE